MEEILRRLARLEQTVKSLVRVGVVSTVNREACRVRVAFAGGFVSAELPVLVHWTVDADYKMPAVDEQVTCIFLPNGTEMGFVLGSFYSDEDPIPEGAEAEGKRVVEFGDGARFEYDTEASRLLIVIGELELEFTPDGIRFGGESGNQPYVRGGDAKVLLEGVIQLIIDHWHPGGVGPTGNSANAAAFAQKKSEVQGLLSTIFSGL